MVQEFSAMLYSFVVPAFKGATISENITLAVLVFTLKVSYIHVKGKKIICFSVISIKKKGIHGKFGGWGYLMGV